MSAADTYRAFRARAHGRVCERTIDCTCPEDYGREVITEARERAEHVHAKFEHPGPVDNCGSPHDVICKAVWP